MIPYDSLSKYEKQEIEEKVKQYYSDRKYPWSFLFDAAITLVPLFVVIYIISFFHQPLETEFIHYLYIAAVLYYTGYKYIVYLQEKPSKYDQHIAKKAAEERREKQNRQHRIIEEQIEKVKEDIDRDTKVINEFTNEINKLVSAKGEILDRRKKSVNYRIGIIKEIDPFEFEEQVAELFNCMGYEVRVTNKTGDKGVDIFATHEKTNAVIQCKRYRGIVHAKELRDFLGAMRYHNASKGYFVTTGTFSDKCYEFEDMGIELIDGNKYVDLAEKVLSEKNRLKRLDEEIDVINRNITNQIAVFFKNFIHDINDNEEAIVRVYSKNNGDSIREEFGYDLSMLFSSIVRLKLIFIDSRKEIKNKTTKENDIKRQEKDDADNYKKYFVAPKDKLKNDIPVKEKHVIMPSELAMYDDVARLLRDKKESKANDIAQYMRGMNAREYLRFLLKNS